MTIDVEVRPRWPVRLPRRGGVDGVIRVRGGVVTRLLHVDGAPAIVRAWSAGGGRVRLQAEAVDPSTVTYADGGAPDGDEARAVAGEDLETAIERMRFALALDDDMGEFFARFRSDPLLGPVIARRPWIRPRRQPWAWEALAWAITKQLIDSGRAAAIERRIVREWGPRVGPIGTDERELRDVPGPALIAGRAPAELVGRDLAEKRALALIRAAREISSGRVDPSVPDTDRRLAAIREIGPWTVQVLALNGRGEADSLPAGDLGFIKLVGVLAGLGRRATVEEVEDFFAPYSPFRGVAGTFALLGWHRTMAARPPLRHAA
jgi:3-methyladenine DNA glycosylase/8-oxoguanine DNA glycosylase